MAAKNSSTHIKKHLLSPNLQINHSLSILSQTFVILAILVLVSIAKLMHTHTSNANTNKQTNPTLTAPCISLRSCCVATICSDRIFTAIAIFVAAPATPSVSHCCFHTSIEAEKKHAEYCKKFMFYVNSIPLEMNSKSYPQQFTV